MTALASALVICLAAGSASAPRQSATLTHREPSRDRPSLSGAEMLVSSTSGSFLVHYTTTGGRCHHRRLCHIRCSLGRHVASSVHRTVVATAAA